MNVANEKYSNRDAIPFWGYLSLACVFCVLLGMAVSHAKSYPYYEDDLYSFKKVLNVWVQPSEIWKVYDIEPRRAPLAVLFFAVEAALFGFSAGPYLVTLMCFHFLNSILVGRLCRSLGGSGVHALLGSLFYLCSSNFFQVIVHIIGTARVLSMTFLLLATLAWMRFLRRGGAWPLVLVFVGLVISMGFNEGPMVFPLLALLLVWWQSAASKTPVRKTIWISLVAMTVLTGVLVFLTCLPALSADETLYQLAGSFRPLFKLVTLAIALVVPFLVPPRGLFGETALWDMCVRFAPFLLFGLASVFIFLHLFHKVRVKPRDISPTTRLCLVGLGWIGISVLPYLLHPSAFYYTSRYIYFPAVGFSLIAGVFATAAQRVTVARFGKSGNIVAVACLVYLLSMNLLSTAYQHQRYVTWVTEIHKVHYGEVQGFFLNQAP